MNKESLHEKGHNMTKGKGKTTWDVYAWVGSGAIKIRESNVSLKDAKKAKEKWVAKSPKHEAFIAAHKDKKIVKGILGETDHKVKPKKGKPSKAAKPAKTGKAGKTGKPTKHAKPVKANKEKKHAKPAK